MEKAAIALVRVSTADQLLSLEAQRAAIEAYARAAGFVVLTWHTEVVSGGKALEARPVLQAAIEDVIANRCAALLIAKRDRLSRDPLTSLLVERAIGPARVLAADSPNGDDPAAKLLRGILDCVAGFERSMISIRTRAALQALKARGARLGRAPGFKPAEGRKGGRPRGGKNRPGHGAGRPRSGRAKAGATI